MVNQAPQERRQTKRRTGRLQKRANKTTPGNSEKEAKQVVTIMAEKYGIEDDYAKEALTTAVEVMRVPGETENGWQLLDWSWIYKDQASVKAKSQSAKLKSS